MFLIFDVDGTMFRNVEFHFEAWQVLFLRYNVPFNDKVKVSLLGRTAREAILDHFGNELDAVQIEALVQEKEAAYRELYLLRAKPIDGLVNLLDECTEVKVGCAVAS